jgi:hypothetical protein
VRGRERGLGRGKRAWEGERAWGEGAHLLVPLFAPNEPQILPLLFSTIHAPSLTSQHPPPHSYFVHYLGWNVRWDKWVGEFDLLADNEETRKIVKMVKQVKTRNKGGGGKRQKVQVDDDIPEGSAMNKLEQMDEEREAERRRLKFLENNSLVEVDNVNPFRAIENAGGKPMGNEAVMRINLPFPIKKMLVEDWEEMKNENSTRRQVLHLPVEVTVDKFLEDFKKDKKGNLKGDDLKKWDVSRRGERKLTER